MNNNSVKSFLGWLKDHAFEQSIEMSVAGTETCYVAVSRNQCERALLSACEEAIVQWGVLNQTLRIHQINKEV